MPDQPGRRLSLTGLSATMKSPPQQGPGRISSRLALGSHPATQHAKLGLDTKALIPMSHSIALRPQNVAESPPQAANCRKGGFDWRCLPAAQSLIESGEFDWLNLRDRPGA